MTVQQMIDVLKKQDPKTKLTITDGHNCRIYDGDFEVKVFEGDVDIGIGGLDHISLTERKCEKCGR